VKVSVVVPLLNESESLPELIKGIATAFGPLEHSYEVVFVDDGSNDNSFDVLRTIQAQNRDTVRVVRFTRNYGKAAALSVGIEKARGEVIVTMDADLQDDPAGIAPMLDKLNEGWDLVSGWKKRRQDPITKTVPSKVFNLVTSMVAGVRLHDFNCGFKAYRAHVAKSLDIYGDRHRYLPVLAHWDGYRVAEMVVRHHPRKYGKTKYGLNRFSHGFFDLLTLVFLRRYLKNPLHFFGLLGIVLVLAGCAILGYFGVRWIVTGQMHIRPLVLLSVGAIIMGIQFFSIGLIGEMITHTFPAKAYGIREILE
jgi:glycosyltransferase involved in cell wall biosynthesis